jgi:hypothetical protein
MKHGAFNMISKAKDKVCSLIEVTCEDNAHLLFNIKGIFHFEFILQGQIVNEAYYVEILKWLREAVRRNRPDLRPSDWILQYDNVAAHKALSSSFWPKTRLLQRNTHPLPLIWFRMTSGCIKT